MKFFFEFLNFFLKKNRILMTVGFLNRSLDGYIFISTQIDKNRLGGFLKYIQVLSFI